MLDPWIVLVAVQKAVMTKVNNIGSTKSQRKPMLLRPYLVSISRRRSAPITLRLIVQELSLRSAPVAAVSLLGMFFHARQEHPEDAKRHKAKDEGR